MEKKLSCGLMLSLQEISLRRVVVILWSQSDIEKSIELYNDWVEYMLEDKIKKLELSPLLKQQLIYLVIPIFIEIECWKSFHGYYFDIYNEDLGIPVVQQLCWTISGTVDYRKTAENLIRKEMFDAINLYKLACLNCLDEIIPELWKKLPEESKSHFFEKDLLQEHQLEFCWAHVLKGETNKLDYTSGRPIGNRITVNQYFFEYSASLGSKAATEYFFGQLTDSEREVSLFPTAQAAIIRQKENRVTLENCSAKHCDTFIYLLSLLSPGQQMEIFKEYPYDVLRFFLDWPWQEIFLDMAEIVWPFLTAAEYSDLLRIMCRIMQSGYNIMKLFQKFYLDGPCDFKKHFVDVECQSGSSFRIFFKFNDSETIKLFFRNIDFADRKRLVSSAIIFKHFYKAISRRKMNLVHLCLQEATVSKEEKDELKEAYFGFLTAIDRRKINRRNKIWEQFLCIFEGKAKDRSKTELDEDYRMYLSTDSDNCIYEDLLSD